jgi:hypothetical protein
VRDTAARVRRDKNTHRVGTEATQTINWTFGSAMLSVTGSAQLRNAEIHLAILPDAVRQRTISGQRTSGRDAV